MYICLENKLNLIFGLQHFCKSEMELENNEYKVNLKLWSIFLWYRYESAKSRFVSQSVDEIYWYVGLKSISETAT